ncbi:hypothetical protein [Paraflavitalea sp. CAU 1676]|uniref:hypothetical protein n=1 Tax=Paraflavitalea sp. CAU 1676 TaxID=3032598 RepID=UPI0023DC1356|nr:hypothetical protein [Paraflavitalea sp. CAU 1676]MDF2192383.1 hypothetical protein [Paraflavitalea sp. CAU 1676]
MNPELASKKNYQLLQQLNDASITGKLSKGLKEVYNAATHRRAALLLIEEDYATSLEVLDDVMEKVLKAGGDVEFVAGGMLAAYDHIILIEK